MRLPTSPSRFLRASIGSILDFAFPWRCVVCQSDDHSERVADFCGECHSALTREIVNSCQKCGAEVGPFVSSPAGCVHCRKRSLKFDSVICLGMYDDTMRRAILSSKWSHSAVGLRAIAKVLAEEKQDILHDLHVDLIIPIPQPWTTRLTRSFNSATVIAQELSRPAKARVDQHILFRKGRVRPQKRVAVHDRYANQQGAFRVQDISVVRGRRLLLVDDVLTTGATCTEASAMLKKAGAAEVHVAVVARVLDNG